MSDKGSSNSGWTGMAIFGAVMFAIGKCSVSVPPPQEPNALVSVPAAPAAPAATTVEAPAATANISADPEPVPAEPASTESTAPDPISEPVPVLRAVSAKPARQCGSKRYCREMNSCGEAMFYLNECGVGRLDRDGDGIPCESIC